MQKVKLIKRQLVRISYKFNKKGKEKSKGMTNAGKISHEVAEALALKEYEKYRVIQDKNYISDFDREVKKLSKSIKEKQLCNIQL